MSRTFRLRHLPRMEAVHFTDAHLRYRARERREKVWALQAALFPDVRWSAQPDIPMPLAPVGAKWSHPWFHWASCRAHQGHTRLGNRLLRRKADMALRDDPDEALYPMRLRETYDLWFVL